ncbi:ribosome biogenesis GTP-binding protein YihA/YsxC [Candidatus Walczuchella monophlebidarum]|uniref:Probable GTP-binding protein EngB n=1 Tax=Candidatus Walczuchella monophlebidarum TaxID=1415657 RepID=A0A068DT35_9FLAO|nr:ribosome biogenesis GTP-binding protein YihA/YsxC [Candidatus Walczuchella monophlebidarum]AID37544.1 ribosome biogenesis GTP-binding protein YsxC [Candidatus Walczuchella monophlebidarum]
MINIQSTSFISSSTKTDQLPEPNFPEYAFAGRSNVGKSSLINMLTNRKRLAKTSSFPGKTRLINHFLINNKWYLADLPGYGYAEISKKERKRIQKLIYDYLSSRENLLCLFVLIDSRLPIQKNDRNFLKYIGENQIPFCLIFTKTDKLSFKKCERNISLYQKTLLEDWEVIPTFFKSSSNSREGKIKILKYIETLNEQWKTKIGNS